MFQTHWYHLDTPNILSDTMNKGSFNNVKRTDNDAMCKILRFHSIQVLITFLSLLPVDPAFISHVTHGPIHYFVHSRSLQYLKLM